MRTKPTLWLLASLIAIASCNYQSDAETKQRNTVAEIAAEYAANLTARSRKIGAEEALPVYMPGSPQQSAHLPFSWNTYFNPENPEFWDDGGTGVLPRPFLHLAANPTEENARKLLEWQRMQWEVIEKVAMTLRSIPEGSIESAYLKETIEIVKKESNPIGGQKNLSRDVGKGFWGGVSIAFIYRSTCPYCRKQVPVLELLEEAGAQIYPFQEDYKDEKPLMAGSRPYDAEASKALPKLKPVTPYFYIKVDGLEPRYYSSFTTFVQFKKIVNQIKGEENAVDSVEESKK